MTLSHPRSDRDSSPPFSYRVYNSPNIAGHLVHNICYLKSAPRQSKLQILGNLLEGVPAHVSWHPTKTEAFVTATASAGLFSALWVARSSGRWRSSKIQKLVQYLRTVTVKTSLSATEVY